MSLCTACRKREKGKIIARAENRNKKPKKRGGIDTNDTKERHGWGLEAI